MIVGFGHRRRMGKDTAAAFVLKHAAAAGGIKVRHVSFAKLMKDVAAQLWGVHGLKDAEFYDAHPELKEVSLPALGKSPRDLHIALGQSVRAIHGDTWLDAALGGHAGELVVVSDVRFPNEAQRILQLGGAVYKVHRPGVPLSGDVADCALDGFHGWTDEILNASSLAALSDKVLNITEFAIECAEWERWSAGHNPASTVDAEFCPSLGAD